MKKLYKSTNDCKIFGVCGGLAEYFEIDATLIRILMVWFVIFAGTGILAYLLAALIMPKHPD